MRKIYEILRKRLGGDCTLGYFGGVVCLVEKGFVICAGTSAVDDSTAWKRNTEGNIVGHRILPIVITGNNVI